MIYAHQQDYYSAINRSNAQNNCAPFIEFMLEVILETIETDQASDQVADQVKRLVKALALHRLSATDLMGILKLSHRPTFRKNYLHPALEAGLIEMSLPNSPRSPTQKYFLTEKGKRMLENN
ncbi:MAG: hypothetical protein FJ220_01290 [Kiritimatiellaceae bacterium]|nr:hypothetical protein [Kiritimatiellaceae bacterium]